MNRKSRAGMPLLPSNAIPLLAAILEDRKHPIKRVELASELITQHKRAGGTVNENRDILKLVQSALKTMLKQRAVESVGGGYWQGVTVTPIPTSERSDEGRTETSLQETSTPDTPKNDQGQLFPEPFRIGSGRDTVYMYFYPSEKSKSIKRGNKNWPCKIGYSRMSGPARVATQGTGHHDKASIAVLINSPFGKDLEDLLHEILKAWGRTAGKGGSEWYLTNPQEIISLYYWVMAVLDQSKITCRQAVPLLRSLSRAKRQSRLSTAEEVRLLSFLPDN